jgi:hypothetical protein
VRGFAIKRFFKIAISSPEIGGPFNPHLGFCWLRSMGPPGRFERLHGWQQSFWPSLIVVTDTAFSSNRFAWTHQIHKLELQVAPKETGVNQLHSSVAAVAGD